MVYIATGSYSSFLYNLLQFGRSMKRLTTTGTLKQQTQKKVIMEGVNLKLEEGKMYLILGAPGCGKSTCEFEANELTFTSCISICLSSISHHSHMPT